MIELNRKASGRRLKLILVKRGMKNKDLANKLGFKDSTTISRWIAGEAFPTYEMLVNIAIILRCKVKDLVVFNQEEDVQ